MEDEVTLFDWASTDVVEVHIRVKENHAVLAIPGRLEPFIIPGGGGAVISVKSYHHAPVQLRCQAWRVRATTKED